MSQHTEGKKVRSIEDVVVVDSDAHVTESFEDVTNYIDDKYEGIKKIFEAASSPLTDIFSVTRQTPSHVFKEGFSGANVLTPGKVNPQSKIEDMDEFGIDYGIATPSLTLTLPSVNNTHYAVAIADGYNAWMADNYGDIGDGRIKSSIAVAPQKPDKAAEEIDEWADEDHIGAVQMPATGLVPPPGHEWYNPIYEAAQDRGLPVLYHSAGVLMKDILPIQERWTETWAEGHALTHSFSHQWNLANMVFQALPERFPDLEFVFQEGGISWVPYWMWRLDDHYLEHNYDVPGLNKLPSEYIRDQFYFTSQPLGHTANNPQQIAQIIEMVGAESVLWASDLPHPDFDTPEELFKRIAPSLDGEQVRKVMGKNAADLFGFDI